MQTKVQSKLAMVRQGRGLAAAELARRVGVSRQTIYAIEAGSFVPNTEVALKLSRELEVPVEALFALSAEGHAPVEPEPAEILSATPPLKGTAVRIGRVGERTVAIPVQASPCFLPEADGVIAKLRGTGGGALVDVLAEPGDHKRLIVAGCDPAGGLLARAVEQVSGIEVLLAPGSSRMALQWLKAGKVHVAGSHLEDAASGEFNLPYLREHFPGEEFAVVTFARWQEGIVVAAGNPKSIRGIADLAARGVRFVNREPGSGSRGLLDRLLAESGVPAKNIAGYEKIAHGHLPAAHAVFSKDADCCLATRAAAQAFGLDFLPLREERYDFVMRRESLDMPAAQALLDVLQKAALRRKLEAVAGYDTAQTGVRVA